MARRQEVQVSPPRPCSAPAGSSPVGRNDSYVATPPPREPIRLSAAAMGIAARLEKYLPDSPSPPRRMRGAGQGGGEEGRRQLMDAREALMAVMVPPPATRQPRRATTTTTTATMEDRSLSVAVENPREAYEPRGGGEGSLPRRRREGGWLHESAPSASGSPSVPSAAAAEGWGPYLMSQEEEPAGPKEPAEAPEEPDWVTTAATHHRVPAELIPSPGWLHTANAPAPGPDSARKTGALGERSRNKGGSAAALSTAGSLVDKIEQAAAGQRVEPARHVPVAKENAGDGERGLRPNREWREFANSLKKQEVEDEAGLQAPALREPGSPREAEFKALYQQRLERARQRHTTAAADIF